MCLRFAFLLIARGFSWLRLSQREDTWKTAEILILRHQLAVLQRQQPRRSSLNWADRALLATLLSVIPKVRHNGMRLLVTPDCPRTLRLMMATSLTVRMQVPGKAPPVVFRRGFGVRGGGLVVSLP
jgi:hypothetical protein